MLRLLSVLFNRETPRAREVRCAVGPIYKAACSATALGRASHAVYGTPDTKIHIEHG